MSDNKRLRRIGLSAALAGLLAPLGLGSATADEPAAGQNATSKPRTIITQDGEVDDMDSFIRFLYYANEFDLEGIVYSSSRFHWAGDGAGVPPYRWTGTAWVDEYIDAYEELYPNLVQHADGYPTPDQLRALYTIGNISNVGEMEQVTEGSEHVKEVILDDEPGPLYVQVWGGLNTVARALKSIQEEYEGTERWEEISAKVNEKVVIYNILTQDSTLADYIRPNWPDIRIIDNQSQFWSFAYQWTRRVPEPYQRYLRGPYMEQNFLEGHGPLLPHYRTYRDGKPTPGDDENNRWRPDQNLSYGVHDFISEGDSPAFMHLLDVNGLRARENPTWGGWGGRFAEVDYGWLDTADHNPFTGQSDRSFPQTRWVDAIQNDFAARADWGVSGFDDANHNPRARVPQGLDLTRKPGQPVVLTPRVTDPDGDDVALTWWQYREAGTYPGSVDLTTNAGGVTRFRVPADAQPGQTIHLILEATDDGTPALTHYQRVVVTVR
ncbi:DUF1593 domain-containing protein [Jiangella endophytica]|uniref:DUF1593 domain-containing protein n=1 Tax=Jiangella endophytica TaxID=1623398 RepID=UPI000E347833|nr:DUF1593 domain-containing protein [Jiangella endophytica]